MISNRSIARRAAALLLFALAALAALARGGVSPRGQALACAGAAVALALAAQRDRRGRAPRLPFLVLAPLLVLGMAALQCLPIPAGLLRLLAPVNALLRFFPPAPAQAFAPITLDLPATAAALTPLCALALALMAAALLARRPRAQALLLAAPVAAALVQLGICLVRLAGQGTFAGSFVNRNHLAALLVLGALAALGAALSPPREEEPGSLPQLATSRPLWIASAAASAAGALLTLSRGATVGLGVGALVLLLLDDRGQAEADARGASVRRRRRRARLVWVALPLAAGLLAASLLATTSLTTRFADLSQRPLTADVKLRSFIGAFEVVLEHPLFGVGRGAWRFVAERHRSVPGDMAFVYVEDEPLQLAAEEGLPLALAVMAICLIAWWRAANGARSGLARGVLAGSLAVALQNLVDFNLEFIGVGLPLAVALGAVVVEAGSAPAALARPDPANPGGEAANRSSTRGALRIPRALLYAAALLGLVLAPLPLLLAPWSAERESARLAFEARQTATSADALLADAAATVARHPADWLSSLAPAVGLHQRSPRRTAEALAWAGRAQLLGPKSWRPHWVAAAILLRAGRPAQARVEARLALENLGGLPYNDPLALAARCSQTLDELLEATPDDPLQRARVAQNLRVQKRPALARALVEHELEAPEETRSPEATAALRTELAILLLDAHADAAAEQVAAELPRADCARALLLSEARRALARAPEEIEQPLIEARPLCPRQYQIYDLLFHGRLARKQLDSAAALLDDPALPDSTLPFAAQVHIWRAELHEARGEGAAGLHERWLSALLAPEEPWRALDYSERLRQQGDPTGALLALRTLELRATIEARGPIEARIQELEALREKQRTPPALRPGH